MNENRAIIDYNTIKENLEMERLQHEIEIQALEEKLRVATNALVAISRLKSDTKKAIADNALELINE